MSAVMVAGHPLPPLLAQNTSPAMASWLAALPETVDGVLEEWSLRSLAPFEPGGTNAWVAPVRGQDGEELVLKVAWAHEESRDEAAGMTAWQGLGAARVLRAELRGETSLLLMERVRPGTPLARLLTWPQRDEVVADLVRGLWIVPEGPLGSRASFRPLSHMCAWWADESRERAEAGGVPLPDDLVDRGLALFRELPLEWDGDQVLLATDLHHWNVLARADGEKLSWVLIDPKPYVGDPHYDVLQHMLNDLDRLTADPATFADRMARLTGLDPARTRRWLLARCVQEAGVIDGAAQAALRLAAEEV